MLEKHSKLEKEPLIVNNLNLSVGYFLKLSIYLNRKKNIKGIFELEFLIKCYVKLNM